MLYNQTKIDIRKIIFNTLFNRLSFTYLAQMIGKMREIEMKNKKSWKNFLIHFSKAKLHFIQ